MANVKPTTYRVYLGEEDAALLKQICQRTELGQEELLKKIAIAGLRAINADEMRVALPLRFVVAGESEPLPIYRLNEPKKPRAK
jgi:hypothetical protein